ncbi:MAG TPA: AI-2E family transporter [Bryobacteraceae bacterium]|nr:AI-2E family transporter [Bryobacteraceae bacterium]
MLAIDQRTLRIVWTVFVFGLLLLLVYEIRETLLVFATAIFFAYMLSPIVALIERFMPKRRALALGIVYVLLVGALVGLGFALIPQLAAEATSLLTRLPGLLTTGTLTKFPLPHWAEGYRTEVMEALTRQAANLQASAVPFIQRAGTQIVSGVGSILPAILVPILAFFFLKDAREIRAAILDALAAKHRSTAELILRDVHEVLRSYIKALIILAAASFAAWVVFLNLMGEPYELLLAGLAGVLEFIPVIGPVAALAIIVLVSGVAGAGGLLWIVLFWALYRVFQDYVLNPFLMSSRVEIHPLLVLFGVLAGEKVGGISGMFFSVPLLAILKVAYGHLQRAHTAKAILGSVPDHRSDRAAS